MESSPDVRFERLTRYLFSAPSWPRSLALIVLLGVVIDIAAYRVGNGFFLVGTLGFALPALVAFLLTVPLVEVFGRQITYNRSGLLALACTVLMVILSLSPVLVFGRELFSALYAGVPAAGDHLEYLFVGLEGHTGMVGASYLSSGLLVLGLLVLLVPAWRRRPALGLAATGAILLSVLVEKGLTLVSSGFVPSPLGYVLDYRPSVVELGIVVGIYAGGALAFLGACRYLLSANRLASESHAFEPFTLTARKPGMAGAAPMEK